MEGNMGWHRYQEVTAGSVRSTPPSRLPPPWTPPSHPSSRMHACITLLHNQHQRCGAYAQARRAFTHEKKSAVPAPPEHAGARTSRRGRESSASRPFRGLISLDSSR